MELARSIATRYVRLRPRAETRPKAKLLSDFVSRRGALGLCVFEVPLVLLFPLVPLDPVVVSMRPALVQIRTHARTHAQVVYNRGPVAGVFDDFAAVRARVEAQW